MTTRPTDRELMLYADGELGAEQSLELEKHLAGDEVARAKLWALRLTGDLVRHTASELSDPGSIADAVMAEIASEGTRNGTLLATATAAPQPIAQGSPNTELRPAADLAKAITKGERRAALEKVVATKRPANDTARRIWTLTAAAVAAAAGLIIWGRMEAEPRVERSQAPITATTNDLAPAPIPAAPQLPAVEESPLSPDGELDMGVEVAAVDFGARTGTIFYVPSDRGASSPTTTVVWLADDVAGGEK